MTTPTITSEAVMALLDTVHDPELHASIVRLGMVKDLAIENGAIALKVELTTPACPLKETMNTTSAKRWRHSRRPIR